MKVVAVVATAGFKLVLELHESSDLVWTTSRTSDNKSIYHQDARSKDTTKRKCKRKHDMAIMKAFTRNNVFFYDASIIYYLSSEDLQLITSLGSGDWRQICLRANQVKEVKFSTFTPYVAYRSFIGRPLPANRKFSTLWNLASKTLLKYSL